jgi:hypothetical protein
MALVDRDIYIAIDEVGIRKPACDREKDLVRLQALLAFPIPGWYRILVQESTIEDSCRQLRSPGEDAVFFPNLASVCDEIESSFGFGRLADRGFFPVGVCAFGTGWMYSVENHGRIGGKFVRHHDEESPPLIVALDFVRFLISTSEQ